MRFMTGAHQLEQHNQRINAFPSPFFSGCIQHNIVACYNPLSLLTVATTPSSHCPHIPHRVMLPHQSILHLPATNKPRRRTIQLTPPSATSTQHELYCRELTIHQAGLGCAAWDASILLARYLHYLHSSHRLLTGAVVMEVGAGVGLPGIVCGRHASRCVLTDYDDGCVENARYNIKLNSNTDDDDSDTRRLNAAQLARSTTAATLDWHTVPPPTATDADLAAFHEPTGLDRHSCDVIVGSEVMYTDSPQHRTSLYNVLSYYLRPHTGRFICMQSINREGMPAFLTTLTTTHHYDVTVTHISESTCSEWLPGLLLGGEGKGGKPASGFQQRDEQYVLYECVSGGSGRLVGEVGAVGMLLDEGKIRALGEKRGSGAATREGLEELLRTVTSDEVVRQDRQTNGATE